MELSVTVVVSALLMIYGGYTAIKSLPNVQRMLLWSCIAEAGFVSMAIFTPSTTSTAAGLFHLCIQSIARLLLYGLLAKVATSVQSWKYTQWRSAILQNKTLTIFILFALFSVLGISPFRGSFSRLTILYEFADTKDWFALGASVVGALLTAWAFLRLLENIYLSKNDSAEQTEQFPAISVNVAMLATAGILAFLSFVPEGLWYTLLAIFSTTDSSAVPHFEGPWSFIPALYVILGFILAYIGTKDEKRRNMLAAPFAALPLAILLISPQSLVAPLTSFINVFSSAKPLAVDSVSHVFAFIFAAGGLLITLYSVAYMAHEKNRNRYYFFLFLMFGALAGVAGANDLGTLFPYWEMMTVSSYFLVVHNQTKESIKAGFLYFIICAGGAYILQTAIAIFTALYKTSSFTELAMHIRGELSLTTIVVLLVLCLIGFAAKAGLFPMHSWLPKAHPVAPSSISAPMSGLLTKSGIFGLIKIFFGVFGLGTSSYTAFSTGFSPATLLIFMGAGTMLVGEVMALFQNNVKRMLAYSTLGQVGEIAMVIGIGTWLSSLGGMAHVINHAVMKNLLFLCVGAFILRAGGQTFKDLEGMGRSMPLTGIICFCGIISIMGLPPFAGFTSKFLMIHAAIDASAYGIAALILIGGILSVIYYTRLLRTLYFAGSTQKDIPEAPLPMLVAMGILALVTLYYGLNARNIIELAGYAVSSLPITPAGLNTLTLPWENVLQQVSLFDKLPPIILQWPTALLVLAIGIFGVLILRKNPFTAGIIAALTCALVAILLIFDSNLAPLPRYFAILITSVAALNLFYSCKYMDHSHTHWRYYCTFLLLIMGLVGMAHSTDLFNFFAFWEIMSSWALYLVISHEGNSASLREGLKYFLFNMVGASCLFVGVLLMGKALGTFQMASFSAAFLSILKSGDTHNAGIFIGACIFILAGFVMKAAQLPVRIDWQMHPPTAPTPVSGYISAALLKSGPFGILMILGFLWPNLSTSISVVQATRFVLPSISTILYCVAWIGAITIVFSAAMSVMQKGIKRMLIYSTVSQIGYMILAIAITTPLAVSGGMLHVANHLLFKNLLFLCAGAIMYRTHALYLDDLSGVGRKMPVTMICFAIGLVSVVGLPPFNGFTSKWIIYEALLDQGEAALAVLALGGSVITMAYFAKFLYAAFFGAPPIQFEEVREVNNVMLAPMIILSALCIITGIWPGLLLMPIAEIINSMGLVAPEVAMSGITNGPGSWNPSLVTGLALLATLCCAFLWWLFKLTSRNTRIVPVHTGGVGDLSIDEIRVPAEALYDVPIQFLDKLLQPFTCAEGYEEDPKKEDE